jgi:hypothetical protein
VDKNVKEIWKPVVGKDGRYEVSNLGRVAKLYIDKDYSIKRKIMTFGKNNNGYLYCINRLVHRIVAEAFIENVNNFSEVHHINSNRKDNRAENLEWCSRSYNNRKKYINKKRGVHWNVNRDKWCATIKIKGKSTHLGLFSNKKEAYKAYYNKYIEVHNEKPW